MYNLRERAVNMKKINLGKKEGTLGMGNEFWIKKFKNGVKIRKKGQGEVTLEVYNVFEMLLFLRKYCLRNGFPALLTAVDLAYIWQKYPETKEFIERLLTDEITYEEKMKIHEFYMTKNKIVDSLKDEK